MSDTMARRASIKYPENPVELPDLREYDLITWDLIIDKLRRIVTSTELIRRSLCPEDDDVFVEGPQAEDASWGSPWRRLWS